MNTKQITRIVAYTLIVIVFNLIFFMFFGIQHTSAVWIAYIFTHITFLVACAVPFVLGNKRFVENNLIIYSIADIYAIISVLVNIGFMLLKTQSVKMPLLINVILMACVIIVLMVMSENNKNVEQKESLKQYEKEYVKQAANNLKISMNQFADKEIRKEIEAVYDLVRTSPIHSKPAALDLENEVIRLSWELCKASETNDKEQAQKILSQIKINAGRRNAMV